MNTKVIYSTGYKGTIRSEPVSRKLKRIMLKVAGVLEFDADNIAKSKDWPFLWNRKPEGKDLKQDQNGVERC
jgi:hypothetical protein